jgi:hypothetical protein
MRPSNPISREGEHGDRRPHVNCCLFKKALTIPRKFFEFIQQEMRS